MCHGTPAKILVFKQFILFLEPTHNGVFHPLTRTTPTGRGRKAFVPHVIVDVCFGEGKVEILLEKFEHFVKSKCGSDFHKESSLEVRKLVRLVEIKNKIKMKKDVDKKKIVK